MKAVVFHKPKDVRVDTVEDPKIQESTDAIIRVTSTAICGSDLHIYNGMIPQAHSMVLGHEFMGVVEEVGSSVSKLKRGDRVIVPFPIACGHCHFCGMDLPTHCETSNPKMYGPEGEIIKMKGAGAALYGYTDLYGAINGGQAEYARVLYADYNPRIVPDGIPDEEILFLTDIFPTGWAACEWAQVTNGDVVVVFGCGPVGIMAQKAAWMRGAKRVIGVDRLPYRLEMAKRAAGSEVLNPDEVNVAEVVRDMTGGYGADVCIDAVGMEAHRTTMEKLANVIQAEKGSMEVIKQCFNTVRRAGRVSIVGVYGSPYDNFPVYQWFEKSVQVMLGQAWVQRWLDQLIDFVRDGKVKLSDIITHRVSLAQAEKMYDIFNKKEDGCVKVVLNP
jgi:S-(hydroxymethyl)glutathione dehydrogenase / alcohol dehydrogenase